MWHGVAGRGAAGRSGGWRTGIRNPVGGEVMASVYLLNTSVKFSICREPARGCGREVVGRGWVCLVVHGVWGRGFARRPWRGTVPGRSACCSRGYGVDVGSVLARGAPGCGAVCTPRRAGVHVYPPMCSVLGWMCPVFGGMCPVFGPMCPVFGWRCSRGLTTRSPGAMRSGRATGCIPRPWSAEAGVDALTRAGRCMGWEGIPRCAAFIWPSWPPRAPIRPSASSIGPGGGRGVARGGPVGLHRQAAGALQCLVPAPDHLGSEHGLTLDAPTQLLIGFRGRRRNPGSGPGQGLRFPVRETFA